MNATPEQILHLLQAALLGQRLLQLSGDPEHARVADVIGASARPVAVGIRDQS